MIHFAITLFLSTAPLGCTTTCGLFAPLVNNCQDLKDAEAKIIATYAKRTKWKAPAMCSALKGWTLYIQTNSHNGTWPLPDGKGGTSQIWGITLLNDKALLLGTAIWDRSALAHELGHVWEWVLNGKQGGHEKWTERGICTAINESGDLRCHMDEPRYSSFNP